MISVSARIPCVGVQNGSPVYFAPTRSFDAVAHSVMTVK